LIKRSGKPFGLLAQRRTATITRAHALSSALMMSDYLAGACIDRFHDLVGVAIFVGQLPA
jgi:hypothetical protein